MSWRVRYRDIVLNHKLENLYSIFSFETSEKSNFQQEVKLFFIFFISVEHKRHYFLHKNYNIRWKLVSKLLSKIHYSPILLICYFLPDAPYIIFGIWYHVQFISWTLLSHRTVAIWAFNFDTEAFFHCGTIDWEKRERERDERK